MTDARQRFEEAMREPLQKVQRPKLAIVSRTEFPADVERDRARRAAKEAAIAERRELEAAQERERRLLAWEAVHYHAVEEKWHAQQARELAEAYRGFHSREG